MGSKLPPIQRNVFARPSLPHFFFKQRKRPAAQPSKGEQCGSLIAPEQPSIVIAMILRSAVLVTARNRPSAAATATAVVSSSSKRSGLSASSKLVASFSSSVNGNNNSNQDRLLVVGSGVAGSATALVAAEIYKIPVTMVYAGNVATDCNSYWAQGGIIYRNYDPRSGDSAESLAADIHRAGAGLCLDQAVQKVAREGPDRVRQLLLDDADGGPFANVPFDRTQCQKQLSLCMEASHAAPRILHNADHTGRTITTHLVDAVRRHPLIEQKPHTVVTDLILSDDDCESETNYHSDGEQRRCIGIRTLDRATGKLSTEFGTYGTVLCNGGLAGIYQHSTNPPGFNALGSSVALAVRANVVVQDLEFVQFHPTSLFLPNESRFLLTEALRGEGAVLRDADGRAFARDYHEDGELAPRDVVARAVFEENQKRNDTHNAYLDITHRDTGWLRTRFPSIQAHLEARNLDLARDRLPIVPAAHYTCGGISTDLQGRTSLQGLMAAGEAARTGLHGGNRLASTSLLEGLVFGASVAEFVGSEEGMAQREATVRALSRRRNSSLSRRRYQNGQNGAGAGSLQYNHHLYYHKFALEPSHIENAAHRAMALLGAIRRTMWDYVGVVRTPSGLGTALDLLTDLRAEADELHATCPTLETAAVRDAAFAGVAVVRGALSNPESIGAHCIVPDLDAVSDSDSDSEEDEQQVVAAAR